MSERANINKILEIDMDTDREFQVSIMQLATTNKPGRRPPDPSQDINDDLLILCNGSLAAILSAEMNGVYPPGGAMKKFIEKLQEGYVDASAEPRNFKVTPEGKRLE